MTVIASTSVATMNKRGLSTLNLTQKNNQAKNVDFKYFNYMKFFHAILLHKFNVFLSCQVNVDKLNKVNAN